VDSRIVILWISLPVTLLWPRTSWAPRRLRVVSPCFLFSGAVTQRWLLREMAIAWAFREPTACSTLRIGSNRD
jgi:hypothetical protein